MPRREIRIPVDLVLSVEDSGKEAATANWLKALTGGVPFKRERLRRLRFDDSDVQERWDTWTQEVGLALEVASPSTRPRPRPESFLIRRQGEVFLPIDRVSEFVRALDVDSPKLSTRTLTPLMYLRGEWSVTRKGPRVYEINLTRLAQLIDQSGFEAAYLDLDLVGGRLLAHLQELVELFRKWQLV